MICSRSAGVRSFQGARGGVDVGRPERAGHCGDGGVGRLIRQDRLDTGPRRIITKGGVIIRRAPAADDQQAEEGGSGR